MRSWKLTSVQGVSVGTSNAATAIITVSQSFDGTEAFTGADGDEVYSAFLRVRTRPS